MGVWIQTSEGSFYAPRTDRYGKCVEKVKCSSDVVKRLIDCRKEIEEIVRNSDRPMTDLLCDDLPVWEQVESLIPNLPKGVRIEPKIVKEN